MTAEYERYHGIVIRDLVVCAERKIALEVFDEEGRVNAYRLDGRTGIYIKHCAKRLSPWGFTFNDDAWAEFSNLARQHKQTWAALVCGYDGVAVLTFDEMKELTEVQHNATRFIRVSRDRNTMYRVFGNAGKLNNAKARGVGAIFE